MLRTLLLIVTLSCLTYAQELKPTEIYKKSLPAVMTLNVIKDDGAAVMGSAFLSIKDGVAVTAWHVVNNARSAIAKFSTGEEYDVSGLIDKDEKRDIALIRVKVFGKPTLSLSSIEPEVGSKAFVIGAPKGLEFSISDGLISQIQLIESNKLFQFSCPASPGNSGGPIFNSRGQVLGVVSFQVKDGQNLNFAIPAIYVLGLDASLPTQPWVSVKPVVSFSTAAVDEGDKIIADAFTLKADLYYACYFASKLIVEKENGYKEGVPSVLYSLVEDGQKTNDQLKEIANSGSIRMTISKAVSEDLAKSIKSAELMIQAIRTAQNYNGWNSEANDLISRSFAIIQTKSNVDSINFKSLKESITFRNALPNSLKVQFGFYPDSSGFMLGVHSYSRNSLAFPFVEEKSLAYKLDLRSGDVVKSIDGIIPTDIFHFKWLLKQKMNATALITVIRKGEEKLIEIDVPSDLSKYTL